MGKSNPSRSSDYRKKYRKKNRAQILRRVRVRKYGITVQELKQLEARADGHCEVCKRKRPLVLDHDHTTSEVRGLICRKYNIALGFLDDNFDLVMQAAMYLEGY